MTTTIRALAIPVVGKPVVRELRANLRSMQDAIGGGWLEAVVLDERGVAMYFDEEGKIKGLPVNPLATLAVEHYRPGFIAADVINGDAVIVGGTPRGDEADVPADVVELVTTRLTEGTAR